MAAPAKDGFSEILKVVCSMLSRNECAVFREPVDWKGLELLDYPEIVQRPMDLGTIKKKIENDDYACVEDVATDIRLVWSNCMLYNRDGSEVRSQIISLSSDVCRRLFYCSSPSIITVMADSSPTYTSLNTVLPSSRDLCQRF
jgi:Bromodomain